MGKGRCPHHCLIFVPLEINGYGTGNCYCNPWTDAKKPGEDVMDGIICGEFSFSSATLRTGVVVISNFELQLAVKHIHPLNTAAHDIVRSSRIYLSNVLLEILYIK